MLHLKLCYPLTAYPANAASPGPICERWRAFGHRAHGRRATLYGAINAGFGPASASALDGRCTGIRRGFPLQRQPSSSPVPNRSGVSAGPPGFARAPPRQLGCLGAPQGRCCISSSNPLILNRNSAVAVVEKVWRNQRLSRLSATTPPQAPIAHAALPCRGSRYLDACHRKVKRQPFESIVGGKPWLEDFNCRCSWVGRS